ncbi:snare associated Golgi protein-domain-containing protein [Trametes gibbosa]|nr:snare associated Golgi protein-domain-containing protein [Trametes gibbosa]
MLKWRYWFRKDWLWYYIAFVVCLVGVILFTVYHKQIVNWLKPAADWMHDLPFGWTIPIGVLFVISFPPLFGHEIVAILCGLVWGLWLGFAIVAAGTFLGEVGNFYAFKYCCAARGEKLEKNNLSYACLARVVREGGFRIALIARLSAIPGHFTTAVFSTCGMSIWTFSIAAILSLPKQFITVYLGVALEQSEDGQSSTRDTIIKDVVLGATTLITIGAMWYIYHKMNQAKPHVIYERRKARQAKFAMSTAPGLPYSAGTHPAVLESTASVFNPNVSDVEIPLTAGAQSYGRPSYQQWDRQGRPIDNTSSAPMYAPQPQRPTPQRTLTGDGYPMSEYRPQPRTQGQSQPQQRSSPLPPGAGYAQSYAAAQDPFADSARVQEQPHAVSYQRQAPSRGYGSPPPGTFTQRPNQGAAHRPSQSQAQPQPRVSPAPLRPPPMSAPQTPTQGAYFQPPPPPMPPMPILEKNPFEDPQPMPNPYESRSTPGAGHAAEPKDATFYTAVGHSRDVSEAEADSAYESSAVHADANGAPPPPAYSATPF